MLGAGKLHKNMMHLRHKWSCPTERDLPSNAKYITRQHAAEDLGEILDGLDKLS